MKLFQLYHEIDDVIHIYNQKNTEDSKILAMYEFNKAHPPYNSAKTQIRKRNKYILPRISQFQTLLHDIKTQLSTNTSHFTSIADENEIKETFMFPTITPHTYNALQYYLHFHPQDHDTSYKFYTLVSLDTEVKSKQAYDIQQYIQLYRDINIAQFCFKPGTHKTLISQKQQYLQF